MNKKQMQYLFEPIIDGQGSWAELFQSINAFQLLIKAIFIKHGLEISEIENLTPGTNAVFRIKDKVIKIFAPLESGFSTNQDYFTEINSLKHANKVGITAPTLLCTGSMEDKYLFRYIVMDFIKGEEAEDKLAQYSMKQKRDFALKLKSITKKINTKIEQKAKDMIESEDECTVIPIFDLNACIENSRWNDFPESFRQERKAFIQGKNISGFVYTHGDITGENLIIDEKDDIYIIDFADSHIAPYYYEWAPIVFALFGCHPILMEAYFGDYHTDDFYDILTLSMVIHDFGAGILGQICDVANISAQSIMSISDLRALLIQCIDSGQMKVR